jgi:hypothetical protein
MTECMQEIGFLQSIISMCVELEKMPLITLWKKFLGDDNSSVVVRFGIKSLWLAPLLEEFTLIR